jgi:hypothetical protein
MLQPDFFRRSERPPLIVSYGMGVDSTALLIGYAERGIRPDMILFADVGSEKPATYEYGREIMAPWLESVGFPKLVTVRYQPQRFKNWPPYSTIEENCLTNSTVPSIAFRRNKSCSQKWKISPQEKWTTAWEPAQAAWSSGMQVGKVIGYDAGPADLRRKLDATKIQDPLYSYDYPLITWGWDREKCKEVIRSAGLPVPLKSACFFCPSTRPEELHEMPADLLRRIVMIEARAREKLTKIDGLWGHSTKRRSGRMTDYIRIHRLLDPDEIDSIWQATPTGPIYQDQIDDWRTFIDDITTTACSGCTACSAA